MQLQETIVCATAAPGGTGAVTLHDIQTGTILSSFKHTNAGPQCTAVVESRAGQGGFMLSAQPDKSILNMYSFQKDQIAMKIVLPERLTCIAMDRRGVFCAGGTAQGRIHLWEVASGILYNSWDAHYRQVNVLRFSYDCAALFSGSEDSGVSVWSLFRLVDNTYRNEVPLPYCLLSDHTLAVSDIICGVGPFPTCRVLTSSLDHSVKLWDISSKSLLTTFQFPRPIACLAWDLTERLFFAASSDGAIHQVNLFRQRDDPSRGPAVEAVGGAGLGDVVRVDDDVQSQKRRLVTIASPITCLAISLTSSLLIVGTATGLIHLYDISSHQLLRTISSHKGLSVTFLMAMLKPPDLIGHVRLDLAVGASAADIRDSIPVTPVVPFQRTKDMKSREAHEVSMLLKGGREFQDDQHGAEDLGRDHVYFVGPSSTDTDGTSTAALQARVAELEKETGWLREQLGKAKGVNDVMWENVVKRVLTPRAEGATEGETGRKRAREERPFRN